MFTPQLVQRYKSSKSNLPLSTWVNIIGKNLPEFKNDENVFNPIPINIKIAGNTNTSNGSVSVSISPSNPNWYETLVGAIEKMVNKKNIDIVNYVGVPIKNMSMGKLTCVGECDVIDKSGKTIRIDKVVQPPLELATNKTSQLKGWWNENRDELSTEIAEQLKGLTTSEIAKAVVPEGPVFNVINEYLNTHTLHDMSWDEFTSTFGRPVNSEDLANNILDSVRQSLVANEIQIRDFHATEGIGSEASLWKKTPVGKNKYKDDFTMFRDIVEDAIYHPMIGQKTIQSIIYGKVDKKINKGQRKPKNQKCSECNPIASYYKEYHYSTYDKLPGHVIESYNKSFGKIETKYPGDADKAIQMFNLFSGRSVSTHAKIESNIPMERSLPKLVPIESNIPMERSLPELVPIGSTIPMERSLPELVPIGSNIPMERSLPKLVPIGSKMLPKLVPIESNIHDDDHEPSLLDFL